jgi:hypothetical protein
VLLGIAVAGALAGCSVRSILPPGDTVQATPMVKHIEPRFDASILSPIAASARDQMAGIRIRITNLGQETARPTCALRALEPGTQSVWSASMSTPVIPAGASVVVRGAGIALPGTRRLADVEVACG